MKRLVFLAVAVVAIATIASAGAVAQSNETATDSSVEGELADGDIRILDSSYDGDKRVLEVTVENRGDEFRTLNFVEVVEQGDSSWTWESVRLDPGEETTVVLEGIDDRGGEAAVMVAPSSAMSEQDVEWISTGSSLNWFDGPATWGLIVLSGLTGGIGTFWGTKRYLEGQENEQDERLVEVIR